MLPKKTLGTIPIACTFKAITTLDCNKATHSNNVPTKIVRK